MVFTNAQTTAFFTGNDQMAMSAAVFAALGAEGISAVDHLGEFDKDQIVQIAKNLRSPVGNAAALNLGAKSIKRLTAACDLVRYYETVARTLTAANMQWTGPIRNFEVQWKALKEKKDQDDPETPKLTKNMTAMKW